MPTCGIRSTRQIALHLPEPVPVGQPKNRPRAPVTQATLDTWGTVFSRSGVPLNIASAVPPPLILVPSEIMMLAPDDRPETVTHTFSGVRNTAACLMKSLVLFSPVRQSYFLLVGAQLLVQLQILMRKKDQARYRQRPPLCGTYSKSTERLATEVKIRRLFDMFFLLSGFPF